jgi:hypothetical protein
MGCCVPDAVLCSLGDSPLPCIDDTTCAPSGATCDHTSDRCKCIDAACTVGLDQSCNANAAMSGLAGHCNSASVCDCAAGFRKDSGSGKCRTAVAGEQCDPGGFPAYPHCNAGLTCEPGTQLDGSGTCIGATCPALQPANGSGCVAAGLSCDYPPATTCTCQPADSTWHCV